MAEINPTRPGYWGTIKSENPQSRIMANTAILSYDANETETIFGQNLRARYHVTDTWLRRNGEWSDRDERHGRKSREVAVERSGELPRYNGGSSPARPTVIMKTRRSAKPTE